ncbi:MAG TPA: hypothetical protein VET82_01505 [Candidatus Eisenbacteria bacterium]|nr:hypothetical protein [Candidatus Eisenbacteria bacterium]
MDNVIPWSQIHPSITSRSAFVGVVVIDPERQLCLSELVDLEPESLNGPDAAAGDLVASAQQAAARVAQAYRAARRGPAPADSNPPRRPVGLRVLPGGVAS